MMKYKKGQRILVDVIRDAGITPCIMEITNATAERSWPRGEVIYPKNHVHTGRNLLIAPETIQGPAHIILCIRNKI